MNWWQVIRVFSILAVTTPVFICAQYRWKSHGPKFESGGLGYSRRIGGSCRMPGSGYTARLYFGDGGATTAASMLVTYDSDRERPVFYSAGYPGDPQVYGVECLSDAIRLAGVGADVLLHVSKDKLSIVDGNDHEWPWQPTDWVLAFCIPLFMIVWLRVLRGIARQATGRGS